MKLTKELISAIMRKKVHDCSKEEIAAILKMFGCQVKEWHHTDAGHKDGDNEKHDISTCFEIHHGIYFMMEVSGDNSSRVVSYHNEWLMEHGVAMPTENLTVALHMVLNYFLPKMPFDYSGPKYIEGKEYEYESMAEMQELLNHIQEEMQVVMEEVNKADQERKAEREKKRANVVIGTHTIRELLPNMVGELDERKMAIYIEAINKVREGEELPMVSGVIKDGGTGLWGNDSGVIIGWEEFLDESINVGNISL